MHIRSTVATRMRQILQRLGIIKTGVQLVEQHVAQFDKVKAKFEQAETTLVREIRSSFDKVHASEQAHRELLDVEEKLQDALTGAQLRARRVIEKLEALTA